jgi:hypothetical protein
LAIGAGALLPLLGYPLGTSSVTNLGQGFVTVTSVHLTPEWYSVALFVLALIGVLCLLLPPRRRA